MPYARYKLSRRPLSWRGDADVRAEACASGWALTKCGARRAARNWIRGRQAAVSAPASASVPEPLQLAA